MIRVTLSDEDGKSKTCLVSETETPKNILKYYCLNPDTRIIYMNGKALKKEELSNPVPNMPHVHIKLERKNIIYK